MGRGSHCPEDDLPKKKRRHEDQESSHIPKQQKNGLHQSSAQHVDPSRKQAATGRDCAVVPDYVSRPRTPPKELPGLPRIQDEKLLKAVFTHRGVLDADQSLELDRCYDRYEFLGDAYLEVISTRIIFNNFPRLRSGRLATIRESLINNNTLGNFAVAYGFDQRVTIPDQIDYHRKNTLKVFADVFEAYVAAIILDSPSDGFATAEAWLGLLWAPQLGHVEGGSSGGTNAKQDLAKKIGGKEIKIDYVEDRKAEPVAPGRQRFFIDVYLTGWGVQHRKLGSGTGLSKSQAGSEAAANALQDISLIERFAAIKQAFDADTRAKREMEQAEQNG